MSANEFAQEEEKLLAQWRELQLHQRIHEKESSAGDFVFFEGPPTANAKPALHHVLARVFKDIILRYKTMQGFHVDRKAGWDTHGLPVELQVEKKLGISGKTQIENIVAGDSIASIKKFNDECREMVWTYKQEWDVFTERIGYLIDTTDPYITYSNEYIESVWWVFKQMWDEGLVYKSHKVVPYCTRCGTALSSHEVALGYATVKDRSVFVKFPVVGEARTYILSWTTTPWTLPGNVALAVGAHVDYVYARVGDETFVLAKNRLALLEGDVEVMREVKGSALVGLSYEPLFDVSLLQSDTSYKVYAADFVTDTDGTGVVHTAVMYGEDDYMLGEQIGLPRVHTVDEEGKFVAGLGVLSGRYVKDAETERMIFEYLTDRGLLLDEEMYEHEYPFCWRCKTALLYYARDSWFIRVTAVRDEMVVANQTVQWEPSHIRDGRFGEWLNNIRDWAISRERYWGTPLPIWVCSCGETRCVASRSELGADDVELHRPYVDDITLSCSACGGEMKRVREVLDVWFDSGAMPIAQWGFPYVHGSEERLNTHFPADYICEAIDQTRGWFYTLLAVATLLDKEAPYKHVICLGHILDAQGEKMSKSKGNVVNPQEVIDEHGVDALRWHFYTMSAAGEPKRFDVKGVDQTKRRTLMILWNVVNFYELYRRDESDVAREPLDRWVFARMHETIREVTAQLDAYDVTRAARALQDFITDVSVWYVRRSRARFKDGEVGVVAVLREVLHVTARMMAPFTPFLAERVYQTIGGERDSVHLEDWPKAQEIDVDLLTTMKRVRDVVEIGLRVRAEAGMKVRQSLATLALDGVRFDDSYVEILKDELNVKDVVFVREVGEGWHAAEEGGVYVALDVRLTDALRHEGIAREIVRTVNSMRKEMGLTIDDRAVLMVQCDDALHVVFDMFGAYIRDNTRSDEIEFGVVEGEVVKNDVGVLVVGVKRA